MSEIRLTGVDVPNVGVPRNDGTRGSALYNVPIRLSETPTPRWAELFVANWNSPPTFTSMHRPGIAKVIGSCIHLTRTTIEEVEQYHKATLDLIVPLTNTQYQSEIDQTSNQENLRKKYADEHGQHVRDVADRMGWG